MCDRPLEELFDDIKYEVVRFRGEKGVFKTIPPDGDKRCFSQLSSLFITYF